MDSKSATNDDERVGRRAGGDRRVRKEPISHAERRKAERRSGEDRRYEGRP